MGHIGGATLNTGKAFGRLIAWLIDWHILIVREWVKGFLASGERSRAMLASKVAVVHYEMIPLHYYLR
jgi:hypothetical protein